MQRREAPFGRLTLFRTVGPVVGIAFMALLYGMRPHTAGREVGIILQAATLTAVTVTAILFVPWDRLPGTLQATPPLVFLAVAFLAREATGGSHSAYAQLVLLPVVWLGVYGTTSELIGGLLGVAAALVAPLLSPGATRTDWQNTLFLIGVAAGLGTMVQVFFQHLRTHTAQLLSMARTDHLTGVPNRRAWDEELQLAVEAAGRYQRPLSVAMLDLDHFKDHNDRLGHEGGDRLLSDLGERWRSQIRGSDFLARVGGDEFALIMTNCSREDALAIIERLRESVPLGLTCSAGLATWNGMEGPVGVLARADAALYQAKEGGRDRVVPAGSVAAR